MILVDHLAQRLTKIANKRAANASRVHLRYLNASLFHKAAIYADLAKLILNEYNLLARQRFFQQLFNQRCLPSTKEARKNIYLCHINYSFTVFYDSTIVRQEPIKVRKQKIMLCLFARVRV